MGLHPVEIWGGDEGLGEEASQPQAVKLHGAEKRDQLSSEPKLSQAAWVRGTCGQETLLEAPQVPAIQKPL